LRSPALGDQIDAQATFLHLAHPSFAKAPHRPNTS
jgi:hypothetical protein